MNKISDELPFGKKLGMLAKAKGVSQTHIAKTIGLSLSQVNRFFQGQTEIKAEKLIQLMSVLGINIEEIVNFEIAQASGIHISRPNAFGESVEKIARSMKTTKREALIDFFTSYALQNADKKYKSEILDLKKMI